MSEPATTPLEPVIIVIFGITGDLSQRYLLPALYTLFKNNLLPEKTEIVGLTRQAMTTDELFGKVELCINEKDNICDPAVLQTMQLKTNLLQFDPNVGEDYAKLGQHLQQLEEQQAVCMNRLYYLSIPPTVFGTIVGFLGQYGLNASCQHGIAKTRLLIEKPFGSDLVSARQLVMQTGEVFPEEQVFRIDHYLAKETAQNILTFRAQNPIFASIWDNQHIQSIDVMASEKIGIEGRVNFYEGVGALRDLVQSHLLQLVAITTMEMPKNLSSSTIHEAKEALFKTIQDANPAHAVRAQYQTYRTEVNNPASATETYAQIELAIDTERWDGVPLSITTGKALSERKTEVIVTFTDKGDSSDAVNQLTFRIQPNEGIHVQLKVKKPGFEHELQDAVMDFSYQQTFGETNHPNAYERVLVDAVKGDRTLFASSTEVLESWRILQPILDVWQGNDVGMTLYPNGSSGPQ